MVRLHLGPNRPIIEEIRQAAQRHSGGRARIITAWARDEGVRWLLDALNGHMPRVDVIVGVNDRGTTVEAVLRLVRSCTSVSVFFKHPRQTFHPKLYWLDDGQEPPRSGTLIVGSSNVTSGGLLTNFEASIVAEIGTGQLTPENERELIAAVDAIWTELMSSSFCHRLRDENDVRALFEARHLVTERAVRRRQRQQGRSERPFLPTSPPPRIPAPQGEDIALPFDVSGHEREEPLTPENDADPAGTIPLSDRFFVRTLTPNDIRKLHGQQTGTFEPDIGQIARDRFPAFWGWPDRYRIVTRRLSRSEWETEGRLISRLTPPEGVPIDVMLWFRDARPGHPAEHRLRLGPISRVRAVTPSDFDTSSLLVVERAPDSEGYDFIIRLLTPRDVGYHDYRTYLTVTRPHHQFGYGPYSLETFQ